MAKQAASAKAMTKTEVLNVLAEKTELTKKQVSSVLEALGEVVGQQLGKKGPGQFTIPGLVKMKVRVKPAQPAGMRKNPFTGEMKQSPAKPASRAVRVTALKKLKDAV
ncbi:MAG: HU family DNA-binding protein [Planctomycetaceae bacterium]